MEPGRRRQRWAAAGLGLLVGLVLLVGAVLDGGLSTPTRDDLRQPGAAPAIDRSAPRPAENREDLTSWDQVLPSPPVLPPATLVGLLAVCTGAAVAASHLAGPRHRAPALRAARHRGPPVVV